MRKSAGFLCLISALGISGSVAPAAACAGIVCREPTIAPRVDKLPLNASHVVVTDFARNAEGHTEVVIEELAGDQVVGTKDFDTLEVGKRYRVSAITTCDEESQAQVSAEPLEFEVTAPAPLPASLGKIQLLGSGIGEVPIEVDTGSCYDLFEVGYTDVQPDFAGVDPRIRAALVNYRVMVDGSAFTWPLSYDDYLDDGLGGDPFAAEPWRAPGAFRLWTWCDGLNAGSNGAKYGLAAGEHQVYVEATIPDGQGSIVKSAQRNVVLSCDGAGEADDGSEDTDDDVGETTDGGHVDFPGGDASEPEGMEPYGSGPTLHRPAKSGCAVGLGSAEAGLLTVSWLGLLGLALLRRRPSR
jgi:hypothetical protein